MTLIRRIEIDPRNIKPDPFQETAVGDDPETPFPAESQRNSIADKQSRRICYKTAGVF